MRMSEYERIRIEIDAKLKEKLQLQSLSLGENLTDIAGRAIDTAHFIELKRIKKFFVFAGGVPLSIPGEPRRHLSYIRAFSCLVNKSTAVDFIYLWQRFPSFSKGEVFGRCVDCLELIQSAYDRGDELRLVSATGKV